MDKKSILSEVTYEVWLRDATAQLKGAGIETARLDAEIILAHTIKRPRTYLHAHMDETIEARDVDIVNARLDLRLEHTPIAYIIGHKEFYGRRFKVTPATLIPRPETETMIDMVKESLAHTLPILSETCRIVDVGTGSGCIGTTLKLEAPDTDVTLIDISNQALTVARQNARELHADVTIDQGDLLRGYGWPVDIICANLPYVDREWDVSRDTIAEPDIALYATDHGLSLVKQLLLQAASLLPAGGQLFLEADPRQHDTIDAYAGQLGIVTTETRGFIVALRQP